MFLNMFLFTYIYNIVYIESSFLWVIEGSFEVKLQKRRREKIREEKESEERRSNCKKHNSNHLSIHQWIRSAIRDSQQPTSPIGFLFLKFPPPPCVVLLVYNGRCILSIHTHGNLFFFDPSPQDMDQVGKTNCRAYGWIIYIYHCIPVVPHKAVAEISKIRNL